MPAPTHSQGEGGNQEQISFLSLEQNCCHLFHLCSKDVQQLPLCAINSNPGPQRYFLGFNSGRSHQGLRCECQGPGFSLRLGIPCSSQDNWKVRTLNLMCHCSKQTSFLLSNLISVLNSSSANAALGLWRHRGNLRVKHSQFYIFQASLCS